MSIKTNLLTASVEYFLAKDPKNRFYHSLEIWAICTLVCLCFSSFIKTFMELPYTYAAGAKVSFLSSGPIKEFISYMQMSLVMGLVISSSIVFYSLWRYLFSRFCGSGKKVAKIWKMYSGISFGIGALFFLFVIAPFYFNDVVMAGKEALDSTAHIGISFDNYISFVAIGMFITGFLFNSPMVLVLLMARKKR